MAGIKKYDYETGVIGFRIKKTVCDQNETPTILEDLGKVFVKLASRWTDKEIKMILLKHPLADAVIEVLP